MPSLLVTNDFPPKIGGIQSYLYELWRRLPPAETTVFTTRHPGAPAWDARQPFRIERSRHSVLLPSRRLVRDVDALAREVAADVIFVDPMLPLGLIGPKLQAAPYVVVAHGAELTVPGRLPVTKRLSRRVLDGAAAVVAAGRYPARQAARIANHEVRGIVVPPGVDAQRFRPLGDDERAAARTRFAVDDDRMLVAGLSRLVPRKGFDVVIDAVRALPGVRSVLGRDQLAGEDLARMALERKNVAQTELQSLDGQVTELEQQQERLSRGRDRDFGLER